MNTRKQAKAQYFVYVIKKRKSVVKIILSNIITIVINLFKYSYNYIGYVYN